MNPGDRIESDVRAIALPRGRRVGQPGHDVAREYLRGRLEEIGLEPFRGDSFELPFEAREAGTGEQITFTNLAGVVPGAHRGLPPVLVGAHYDSVLDAPCADDNATSVAVALAAAETFAAHPLQRDVVIALFDSEEPPYYLTEAMGSKRFYEDHCADTRFACALIMDLISHDVELGFVPAGSLPQEAEDRIRQLLFVTGAESGGHLPGAVEAAATSIDGLNVVPTLNQYVGDMSDHHAFRLDGQPYLFLSCGQGRYYHHPLDSLDTPGWINFEKTRQVHELVVELLREVDGGEPAAPVPDPIDTTAFEIRHLEAAFGPLLPVLLAQAGLTDLRTREDLNRIAAALRGALIA
jgi:HAMP domain-containing protein